MDTGLRRYDKKESQARKTSQSRRRVEAMKAAEAASRGGAPRQRFGTGWLASLAVYRQPRLIAILLMGFSSGLPLALTASTLSFWLAEIGVSLTTIGFFSLVGISYNLKFLWSPLIDRLPIPFLTARLGRRRSWALVIQVPLEMVYSQVCIWPVLMLFWRKPPAT